MNTIEQIRLERLMHEEVADKRAAALPPGDYYASGHHVMRRVRSDEPMVGSVASVNVMKCESHWDACLVVLRAPKEATE